MISVRERRKAVELVTETVAAGARAIEACKCLGIAFNSYLKWRNCPENENQRPKREFAANPRALSSKERQVVYERYCQPDVSDLSVRQAFYTLLDKGEYLASESTVYRVLCRFKGQCAPCRSSFRYQAAQADKLRSDRAQSSLDVGYHVFARRRTLNALLLRFCGDRHL